MTATYEPGGTGSVAEEMALLTQALRGLATPKPGQDDSDGPRSTAWDGAPVRPLQQNDPVAGAWGRGAGQPKEQDVHGRQATGWDRASDGPLDEDVPGAATGWGRASERPAEQDGPGPEYAARDGASAWESAGVHDRGEKPPGEDRTAREGTAGHACSSCGCAAPSVCRVCPVCEGAALLKAAAPDTLRTLADVASALSFGLRRAADWLAQERADGHSHPASSAPRPPHPSPPFTQWRDAAPPSEPGADDSVRTDATARTDFGEEQA